MGGNAPVDMVAGPAQSRVLTRGDGSMIRCAEILEVRQKTSHMSDVADRVKIVVEHLGVDEAKVTEGASFIDDLGAEAWTPLNW